MPQPHRTTSTAAVFVRPNEPLQLQSLPIPHPLGPGELLVEVNCCTVCGSDLHTCAGRRRSPAPSVLGHETVGVVIDAGEEPPRDLRGKPIEIGDRVVWSVAIGCSDCRFCGRGIPQKCERLRKFGHHPIEPDWRLNGGLAEVCRLPRQTSVLVVDDQVPDQVIAPASCATATVAAALRAGGGDIADSRVLIMGAGMLGLTAIAMLKARGAAAITACDVSHDRLQLAQRFGCDHAIPFDQLVGPFDIILEMSGSHAAMQAALQLADVGGAIVLVGAVFPTDPLAIDPERVVRNLLSLHGVHNYAPQNLVEAVDFLSAHGMNFPFAELVAPEFPLARVNEAIEYALRANPVRVAIRP